MKRGKIHEVCGWLIVVTALTPLFTFYNNGAVANILMQRETTVITVGLAWFTILYGLYFLEPIYTGVVEGVCRKLYLC